MSDRISYAEICNAAADEIELTARKHLAPTLRALAGLVEKAEQMIELERQRNDGWGLPYTESRNLLHALAAGSPPSHTGTPERWKGHG